MRYAAGFPNGAPGANRTHDPQLRRLLLYPTELRAQPNNQIVTGDTTSVFGFCAILCATASTSREVSSAHPMLQQPSVSVLAKVRIAQCHLEILMPEDLLHFFQQSTVKPA
jgi:hypothetical protein